MYAVVDHGKSISPSAKRHAPAEHRYFCLHATAPIRRDGAFRTSVGVSSAHSASFLHTDGQTGIHWRGMPGGAPNRIPRDTHAAMDSCRTGQGRENGAVCSQPNQEEPRSPSPPLTGPSIILCTTKNEMYNYLLKCILVPVPVLQVTLGIIPARTTTAPQPLPNVLRCPAPRREPALFGPVISKTETAVVEPHPTHRPQIELVLHHSR